MGNLFNKDWMSISDGDDDDNASIEAKNSKVIFADFDPRSPSCGIQRWSVVVDQLFVDLLEDWRPFFHPTQNTNFLREQ